MFEEEIIETRILSLTRARGPEKSICPSEVARDIAGLEPAAWRRLMGPVRRVAARLCESGRIEILRHGKPVQPHEMRGVVRLRTRRGGGESA